MAYRLMVTLEEDEAEALARLAFAEMRDPREQIRYWVRQELIRRGVLKTNHEQSRVEAPAEVSTNNASPQSNPPSGEEK